RRFSGLGTDLLACPFSHPVPIGPLCRSHGIRRKTGLRILQSLPLVDFGVPIGESESTGVVVINSREIHPANARRRRWPGMTKTCVVDAGVIFINVNPRLRRIHKFTFLAERAVGAAARMTMITIQPGAVSGHLRWSRMTTGEGAANRSDCLVH